MPNQAHELYEQVDAFVRHAGTTLDPIPAMDVRAYFRAREELCRLDATRVDRATWLGAPRPPTKPRGERTVWGRVKLSGRAFVWAYATLWWLGRMLVWSCYGPYRHKAPAPRPVATERALGLQERALGLQEPAAAQQLDWESPAAQQLDQFTWAERQGDEPPDYLRPAS